MGGGFRFAGASTMTLRKLIFVNRDGTLAALSDRFVVLVGVYRYA